MLPTRGEGFCLPCVEAMSSGLPILVTNHSGPASFMTQQTALPIRVERHACTAPTHGRSDGKGCCSRELLSASFPLWPPRSLHANLMAEPSLSHLRELMRLVASDPVQAEAIGRRARAAVQQTFSAEQVGDAIMQRLRAIVADKG